MKKYLVTKRLLTVQKEFAELFGDINEAKDYYSNAYGEEICLYEYQDTQKSYVLIQHRENYVNDNERERRY